MIFHNVTGRLYLTASIKTIVVKRIEESCIELYIPSRPFVCCHLLFLLSFGTSSMHIVTMVNSCRIHSSIPDALLECINCKHMI